MNSRHTVVGLVLLAWAAGLPAAEPELTWQEANRQSAELVRQGGPYRQAAKLAQLAFDRYATQSKAYRPETHAQLLLNAVDARLKGDGWRAALNEVDRGVAAIQQAGGPKQAVILNVWREAIRISLEEERDRADEYYARAGALADSLWGPSDSRAISVRLDLVHVLKRAHGTKWAAEQIRPLRAYAAGAGPDSAQLTAIDLELAKLELEVKNYDAAIMGYEFLIPRLEASKDPASVPVLQAAYAQLALAHEENGHPEAAAPLRQRLLRTFGTEQRLEPLMRVKPVYPRDALVAGRGGEVVLLVRIDETGVVTDIDLVSSKPPRIFDKAAIEAVHKWRFKPRIIDGKAVPQVGVQSIEFKME